MLSAAHERAACTAKRQIIGLRAAAGKNERPLGSGKSQRTEQSRTALRSAFFGFKAESVRRRRIRIQLGHIGKRRFCGMLAHTGGSGIIKINHVLFLFCFSR